MHEVKLVVCPICHHRQIEANAFQTTLFGGGTKVWIVYCHSKQCGGITATEPQETFGAAVAAWNQGKVSMEMQGG